jgi:hypothetical protein
MISLARIAQRVDERMRVEITHDGQFGKNSSQDGLAHQLRVEITTHDGQFGKNSSEDGLTHRRATHDGQFGKNSSEDGLTHHLRVEIATHSLGRIAQRMDNAH